MSVKIVQLASYTAPRIVESKSKEWVFYGENNNYYQHLIDLYNSSPTNNAAINGISQMIFGKGLDATDSTKKLEEYAMMKSLFSNDCVRRLAYDLKLMGQCAMQVVYDKSHKRIIEVAHFPIETLRSGKANEEGIVDSYFYSADWATKRPSEQPLRFSAYGTSNEEIEILMVKPYRAGYYYYSPVDYQGGLQYAELEEEISNYHLNNIKNSFAPSMLINFNNGIPDEEERQIIENSIKQKWSGTSNAGKFILSFNDNAESQASIETVQLSDAHNQYQFLSDESMRKIMVAHRIISPMLLGIKDNTGLGNNAEELKTASILFDNTVIRPFQELLLSAFDNILAFNNASLNLYFKTLQPLEFVDLENAMTKEQVEEETGQKLSSDEEIPQDLQDFIDLGETDEDMKDWELTDSQYVDYDTEEQLDKEIEELNKTKESTLSKILNFVSSGSAKPNRPSEQDKEIDGVKFKVRYRYDRGRSSETGKERRFCTVMTRANKIYRKEDIVAMENKAVNPGWGINGADNYSIWLYKGGGNCHHRWIRNTFKYVGEGMGSIGASEEISTAQGEKEGYRVIDPAEVYIMPIDSPDGKKGFVNK
jgi:hypothetical protein